MATWKKAVLIGAVAALIIVGAILGAVLGTVLKPC